MSFVEKIELYKWINIILALCVAFCIWTFGILRDDCLDVECLYSVVYGLYDPLVILFKGFLISIILLLLLPSRYFKHWLLFFASWAIPLSLAVIFSESQYSTGGVLGLAGREFNATIMGGLLVVGTILFICGKAIYSWFKTKK